MRRRKEEYKQNNFNGNVNFTGKTQIAAGDIINNISEEKQKTANMIQNQNGVVHLL